MGTNKSLEWLKAHHPPTKLRNSIDGVLNALSEISGSPSSDTFLKEKVKFATKVLNLNEKEPELEELNVAFRKFLTMFTPKV